jgi:hypothetical protein
MDVVDKDISSKKKRLGQYPTPPDLVKFCLDKIQINTNLIIEPSCGHGAFLDAIRFATSDNHKIVGIELDADLATQYTGKEKILVKNFYDYDYEYDFSEPEGVTFIGNPPFRSPAVSLKTHRTRIQQLMETYAIKGIKEESIFFLINTIHLILAHRVKGYIHYILPKSIFQNNSVRCESFISFLKKYVRLLQVWDIDEFPDVGQKLVFVSMEVGNRSSPYKNSFKYNGKIALVDEFYGNNTQYITFQKIFKKTYLGSVPCESLFLSVSGESRQQFRDRLAKVFHPNTIITCETLKDLLTFDGNQHIRSVKRGSVNKIKKLIEYIREIKRLEGFDYYLFEDLENYKPIQHRNEKRFYFRHEFLKKSSFVYILNSNPCPSFYFPGNPSSNSTDYFGFCDYDINRNSGPGANRCVPIEDIEDNLCDEFKEYWDKNTNGLPYDKIFSYILFISKSKWYKILKNTYHRFYFGVPEVFDASFLKNVDTSSH